MDINLKKKIAVDWREFGETYHLAAAMLFDKYIQAYLVYDKDQGEVKHQRYFINSIAPGRVSIIKRDEYKDREKCFQKIGITTKIIAKHFDQKMIKLAFLNNLKNKDKEEVEKYLVKKELLDYRKKMLLWIRQRQCWEPKRNITLEAIQQIKDLSGKMGLFLVYVGHNINGLTKSKSDLVEFYKDCIFERENSIASQLYMFDLLNRKSKFLISVGMMSGAMDGPAFIGVPTIWFAKNEDAKRRMQKLIGIVPDFLRLNIKFEEKFKQLSEDEIKDLEEKICYLKNKTNQLSSNFT